MQFSISLAALPILLLGTLGSALPAVEPRGLPNAQLVCGPFFETTTVDNINKLAYQFKQRAWSGWIRGQVRTSILFPVRSPPTDRRPLPQRPHMVSAATGLAFSRETVVTPTSTGTPK